MTDIPEIGDIVYRSVDGLWEVFVDTDGEPSIRASTATTAGAREVWKAGNDHPV